MSILCHDSPNKLINSKTIISAMCNKGLISQKKLTLDWSRFIRWLFVCTYCKAKKTWTSTHAESKRAPAQATKPHLERADANKGFVGPNVNRSHVDQRRRMEVRGRDTKKRAKSEDQRKRVKLRNRKMKKMGESDEQINMWGNKGWNNESKRNWPERVEARTWWMGREWRERDCVRDAWKDYCTLIFDLLVNILVSCNRTFGLLLDVHANDNELAIFY